MFGASYRKFGRLQRSKTAAVDKTPEISDTMAKLACKKYARLEFLMIVAVIAMVVIICVMNIEYTLRTKPFLLPRSDTSVIGFEKVDCSSDDSPGVFTSEGGGNAVPVP